MCSIDWMVPRRFSEFRNANVIGLFSVTHPNELMKWPLQGSKYPRGSHLLYFLNFKLVACFSIFTWTGFYSVVSDLTIPRTESESWGWGWDPKAYIQGY